MSRNNAALLIDTAAFAGTERHILELARGMKGAGAHVWVGCPAGSPLSERAEAERIPSIELARGSAFDMRTARRLAGKLSSGELEILHAHNGRTSLLATLATRIAGKGVVVATQHFIDPARASRRGISGIVSRTLLRWSDGRVNRFIAVSEAARDAMVDRGEDGTRITVVPNGISEPDRSALESPSKIRQRYGIASDETLVVCCARLEAEKDVGTLLKAMKGVVAVEPKTKCVIAGEGSLADELGAQVESLGIESIVSFAGFLSDSHSLINAADVFVLPSLAEPFGLVLLEAMALGKPVVATRAGGPLEIVEDGRSGLLVPPADSDELCNAILRIKRDSSLATGMGERGLERYLQNFTTKRMAEATLAVYERACQSGE